MNQTVVGVFDSRASAQAASEVLEAQGFPRGAIRITDEAGAATTADADRDDTGFFASLGSFFGRMFGDDDHERHVRPYAEAVRRGHCVLRVDVDDDESSERAARALENAGAVDVDERMSQWSGQSSDTATGDRASATGAPVTGSSGAGDSVPSDSVAGNLHTQTEAAPGPSAVYPPVVGDTPEVVAETERRTRQGGGRGAVRVYPRDAMARTGGEASGYTGRAEITSVSPGMYTPTDAAPAGTVLDTGPTTHTPPGDEPRRG